MLRKAHPHAEITWVIDAELASLLRGNPDVNHVHILPRGELRALGAPTSLLPWLKKSGQIHPDLALDFQGSLRSVLIAKISGTKEIYGMSNAFAGATWFYDRVAQVNRRSHPVERYLRLAECAGATVGESLRCASAIRSSSSFRSRAGQIALKPRDRGILPVARANSRRRGGTNAQQD